MTHPTLRAHYSTNTRSFPIKQQCIGSQGARLLFNMRVIFRVAYSWRYNCMNPKVANIETVLWVIVLVESPFQDSSKRFDRIEVGRLSRPFEGLKWLPVCPLTHQQGCVLWVVVMLEDDSIRIETVV